MMKKQKYILLALISLMLSCSPDRYEVLEFGLEPEQIKFMELKMNSHVLYADGSSELNLSTLAYDILVTQRKDNRVVLPDGTVTFKDSTHIDTIKLQDSRVKSLIKFYKVSGEEIPNGKLTTTTVESFKVFAAHENVRSDTIDIDVRAAMAEPAKITIPVIFHVVRSTTVDNTPTITPEALKAKLEPLNLAFGRQKTFASNGGNPNIEFKLAKYDPSGALLEEEGIHRTSTSKRGADVKNVLAANTWDPKQYLNVWICTYNSPSKLPNTKLTGVPSLDGLVLDVEIGPDDPVDTSDPEVSGIIFGARYQYWDGTYSWNYHTADWKETFGRHFGLLPVYYPPGDLDVDFCDDTYGYDNSGFAHSRTWKTSVDDYLYDSQNLMDKHSSPKTVISAQQAARIRWVTENCPTHWAWKSDFAFTGN